MLSGVGALTGLRHPSHLHTDLDAAVAHARTHVRRSVTEGATTE